ncbi:X-ray repair cross-complementing protein 5 [Orchesella cincta]|uniref:X-ray repair cross-complementing protein 5 n=1 Tax=Orchesella cincta TaxID=48709 RepID=A0A1D2NL71_ORCCI|nr:X-ray repair cross-complementing protein 5 [Orchesella cincta]
MATSWNFAPDSDEEVVEEGESKFGSGKAAILVFIDATPEMFEPWKDGEDVPFRVAIKCCQAMWRSKVVSNEKSHLVSLIFVGTEQSKNSSDFDNIYVLQDLSAVKVAMIEELNAMKNSDDFDGFQSKIGSCDNYDMKDVFWLAKIMFDDAKTNNYKKILYFTRNDRPHDGKTNMQKEVVKKFKDLGKVELNIVAFNDDFSLQPFYSKILENGTGLTKAENLEDLMKIVRVRQRIARPITRSTLELAPGMKIGIGFYSFVRPAKPPDSVNINKRTNELIDNTVNEFHTETGMPVLKSEEKKMLVVGGEKVVFDKVEIKQVKYVYESGVSLICFLNKQNFDQFKWFRSSGYFIHPDEERIAGSKDLFVALLKRCHSLEKIALVKVVLTRGRSPKLMCLVPSLGDPMFPQGFHAFPIPFSDEMRKYDLEFSNAPTPALVELMEKVIKKVTNKTFDVLDVYNPLLQYRWREIERIALDLSEAEQDDFIDLTDPSEEAMIQRLGDLPMQIESEVNASYDVFESTKSTKPIVVKNVNWAIEVKHKRVDKQTVAVLKNFLEEKGIRDFKTKKKAELVQMVYDYFGEDDN